MNPLDRIRREAGISPDTPSDGIASASGGLQALIEGSARAPADLRPLRWLDVVGGGAAAAVAAGHRPFTGWVMRSSDGGDNPVFHWMANTLTVGNVHEWGPVLAGLALLVLLVAAVRTRLFRFGRLTETAAIVVSAGSGGLVCLPMALAVLIGAVALAVIVALAILVVVAGIALLVALLDG